MKKIIFLISFAFISLFATAQVAPSGIAYVFAQAKGDTLSGVDSVAKVIPATAGYNVIGIQVNAQSIAAADSLIGKVYLYESLDNKNYQLTDSASFVANSTFTSTITSAAITPTYTYSAKINHITTPSVYYLVEARSSQTGWKGAKTQFLYTARQYFVTRP